MLICNQEIKCLSMNKNIWMLWYQGEDSAPWLVRQCIESWRKHNPQFNIIVLDSLTIKNYIDLPANIDFLSMQMLSDLVRLELLSRYGGVWVDATVYCRKPLNEWILKYTKSGFFAFSSPGKDRMISSWFLYSNKGNNLVGRFLKEYKKYVTEKSRRLAGRILNRLIRKTDWWFKPVIRKCLNFYPYFAIHYMFGYLYNCDKYFAGIWNKTPKISADIPHFFALRGFSFSADEDLKRTLLSEDAPMYKLNWKKTFKDEDMVYELLNGKLF